MLMYAMFVSCIGKVGEHKRISYKLAIFWIIDYG